MGNWEIASQIATTFGSFLGILTLMSGFVLYRNSKRDAYVTNFRKDLSDAQSSCQRMDSLVTYDFANELATSVVYRGDFECFFEDAKEVFRKAKVEQSNGKRVGGFLEDRLESEPITVAIHTDSTKIYEDLLTEVQGIAGRRQADFPGLYRVLSSAHQLFRSLLVGYEKTVRDEQVWMDVFSSLQKNGDSFETSDHLRSKFAAMLTKQIGHEEERLQQNADDILEIIDLTVSRYAALAKNGAFFRQSAKEKRAVMKSMRDTREAVDALLEAEKALKSIFSEDDLLKYRSQVIRLKTRSEQHEQRRA
ncbi:hypothetical protein HRW07_02150 [Streptomyces lunaelactis]|uniref:hypothetical protein n=1 Tax=Streptomyces lunaelactis TaxID=1535768 RepID=UPI0015859516|nr:hypothetical protein [Streptomyces lunaelactis]NUL02069.1 hypothetical protein [Streptomyces lunaelactis]